MLSILLASSVHVWTDVRALVYFYNVTDSGSWMDFSRSMVIISTSSAMEDAAGKGPLELTDFSNGDTGHSINGMVVSTYPDGDGGEATQASESYKKTNPLAGGVLLQHIRSVKFPSEYFPSFSSYTTSKPVSLLRAEFPTPLLVPQLGGTGNRGKLSEDHPPLKSHFAILLDDLLFRSVFPQTRYPYPDIDQTAIAVNIARWLTLGTFLVVSVLIALLNSPRKLVHLLVISMVVILLQAMMTPLTVFPNENPACVPFLPTSGGEWLGRILLVSLGAAECCHSFIFSESSALLMVLLLFCCTLDRPNSLWLLILSRLGVLCIAAVVAYCMLFARLHYLVDVGVGSMIGGLIFWLYYTTLSLSRLFLDVQWAKPCHAGGEDEEFTLEETMRWTPLVPINSPTLLMRLIASVDWLVSPSPSAPDMQS